MKTPTLEKLFFFIFYFLELFKKNFLELLQNFLAPKNLIKMFYTINETF